MARLRPVEFDDRLTIVEHLDELRTRILICLFTLVVAAGVCFWQNHAIIELANGPLPANAPNPSTFSPTEAFMTTLMLCVYAALIVTMPVVLYQAYAFVVPALTSRERRVIVPLLLMVPFLFIGGVVFAYYVVMPAALDFLLDFNADEFTNQLRARELYSFLGLGMLGVGILFQIPIGVLLITRLGIVTHEQLARNRRYAVLVIAILAMLLPGTDPITMLLSMAPLLVLFEVSLVLTRFLGRAGPSEGLEMTGPEGPSG